MTSAKFDLMTFDALEMLQFAYEKNGCSLPKGAFTYDMRFMTVKRRLLAQGDDSMDSFFREDAPLFYQIRECLKNAGGKAGRTDEGNKCLREAIVFLDFSRIYSASEGRDKRYYINNLYNQGGSQDYRKRDEIVKRLFTEGFNLIFPDDNAAEGHRVHYVPFDKSSSMSRKARISFIDRTLREPLEPRLCLDMDVSGISGSDKFNRSKYFAYRGLYLSNGIRMDCGSSFILNEETVLVLPDNEIPDGSCSMGSFQVPVKHTLEGTLEYITVDVPEDAGEAPFKVKKLTGKNRVEVTAFDGEGLVCPEYSSIMNHQLGLKKVLRNGEPGRDVSATSFQIRMPFVKGMLHQVDFHGFLKDEIFEGTEENKDTLLIVDAFGIRRRLANVRIILTVSMFKIYYWLKDYCALHGIGDPMQYYFWEFRKYSHALYICQTDLGYTRDYASLTYQFLNTLDMDEEQFEGLVGRHMDYVRNIGAIRKADYEKERDNPALAAWKYALAVNDDFAGDTYIQRKLHTEKYALLRNLALGNLRTAGYQRYLSDDLLALLLHIAECIITSDEAVREKISGIKARLLYDFKFFLPYGRETPENPDLKLNKGEYCGFLRSPHLSRNEDCLLRAYQPSGGQNSGRYDLYARYFAHLSGIVMLSYKSDAAQILGGADYDGDLVQIILDKDVNKAIAAGAYIEDAGRPGILKRHMRTAFIPDAVKHNIVNRVCYPGRPERQLRPAGTPGYYADLFDTVRKTFSNNIGRISNTAFRLGRAAYHQAGLSDEEREELQDACALCTVITGMDIDASKTGVRPDVLSWIEGSMNAGGGAVKEGKVSYLDMNHLFKSEDDLINMPEKLLVKEENGRLAVSRKNGEGRDDYKEIFKAERTGDPSLWTNVDMLPYYYAVGLREAAALPPENIRRRKAASLEEGIRKEKLLFRFQTMGENPHMVSGTRRMQRDELRRVIGSYKRISRIRRNMSFGWKYLNQSGYIRYIYNMLDIEYDYETDCFAVDGKDFVSAMSEAYYVLEELVGDIGSARKAMHLLKERGWAYAYGVRSQQKILRDVLKPETLFKPDANPWKTAETLLEDPSDDGYRILLYMLCELRDYYKKECLAGPDVDKYIIADGDPEDNNIDAVLFNDILRFYRDGLQQRESAGKINRKIQKACWDRILEIYGGDTRAAVEDAWSLRSIADSNGNFFWNVIDNEALKREICISQEKERGCYVR